MFVKSSAGLQMALLLPLPACGFPRNARLSPPVSGAVADAGKCKPPAGVEAGKRCYWRY